MEVADTGPVFGDGLPYFLRLQWSRGSEVADTRASRWASLGAGALQWSRGSEVADTSQFAASFVATTSLQWSRGLEVADTLAIDRRTASQNYTLQWSRGSEVADTPHQRRS